MTSANRLGCALILGACFLSGCSVHPADVSSDAAMAALAQSSLLRPMPSEPPAPVDLPATPPETAIIQSKRDGAEAITIDAKRSFAGLWRLDAPNEITITLPNDFAYSAPSKSVCRFEQVGSAVTGACLPFPDWGNLTEPLAGRFDDGHLRLRISDGGLTIILAGTVDAMQSLNGGLSIGLLGLGITPDVPATARRMVAQPAPPPEREAALRMALRDIAAGSLDPSRYTETLRAKLQPIIPALEADAAALGDLAFTRFLDRVMLSVPGKPPERFADVYEVAYAAGTRLCGIDLDPEGKVSEFICR